MSRYFYSMLANNPTTAFWVIVIGSVIVGIILGYFINVIVRRVLWKQWLPVKHHKEMTKLDAELWVMTKERNFYESRYQSIRVTVKAATSILNQAKLEEELPNEYSRSDDSTNDRKDPKQYDGKSGRFAKKV